MKKLVLLISSAIVYFSAYAQDTLRMQDLPSAGDIFVLSIGQSFAGMNVTATGQNYSWDFSDLGRDSQRIDTILTTSATNPLLSFFFINSGLNINRSNHAVRGDNFNLGFVGLENVFNYYYNSSSSYTQTGFGAVIDSIPIPIAYTPHDVLYNFPLTYQNEDSCSFGYSIDLPSPIGRIYYEVRKTRHNQVDGWGTLMTPFGTFDVVRIKSKVFEQDSIYTDTLHAGAKPPPVITYEYKWMGKGFGLPLLQINTNNNNTVTQILYQDSVHLTSVAELPVISEEPRVFPNPASEKIIVAFSMNDGSGVYFDLYDQSGRLVFRKGESGYRGFNLKTIDLASQKVSPGNYYLKISSGNSSFTKAVQVQ